MPSDKTRRTIAQGEIVGVQDADGAFAWFGIPYAAPPVNELRWCQPEAPASWNGIREQTCPGSPAMQMAADGSIFGSEDSLYLNVWSPPLSPAEIAHRPQLPVMVWIHGGGNVSGWGDSYPGARLAALHNVIVVTFNYRLGIFGWFYHPALADTAKSAADASGNFGTLDILQALAWVRDNIASFGGDPDCVTIFGESSGGCNVFSMLVSPLAAGLFHRAIIQSGYHFRPTLQQSVNPADGDPPGTARNATEIVLRLLQRTGAYSSRAAAAAGLSTMTGREIAAWLRRQPYEAFCAAVDSIPDTDFAMEFASGVPQLFRDGHVLPRETTLEVTRSGTHNRVPVMIGSNRDELSILMAMAAPSPFAALSDDGRFHLPERDRFHLAVEYASALWRAENVDRPARALAAAQQEPVFIYRFDWARLAPAPWWDGLELGATHGLDVPFVFGSLDLGPEFVQLPLIYPASLDSFRKLSDAIMGYWVQFAREGDPARGCRNDLPEWRRLDADLHSSGVQLLDWPLPKRASPAGAFPGRDEILGQLQADPRLHSNLERQRFLDDLKRVRATGLQEDCF